MADPPGTPKASNVVSPRSIVAVYHSDSPVVVYKDSVREARALISTPEMKQRDARFKVFKSMEDSENYFKENPVAAAYATHDPNSVLEPGYRSPHRNLKPGELTALRNAIMKHDHDVMIELMDKNPCYFIDMSLDQPTILHVGLRLNALHYAVRHENMFAAREIMRRISDVSYIRKIYAVDVNSEETAESLVAKFLNTPDKGNARTPVALAAAHGFYPMAAYLTSFVQCDYLCLEKARDGVDKNLCIHNNSDPILRSRVSDCFRAPHDSYCITLYRERNDLISPFLVITTRFPDPCISDHLKAKFISTVPLRAWSGENVDGNCRISDACLSENEVLPFQPTFRRIDILEATSMSFVPYIVVGYFGSKKAVATFYKTWNDRCKDASMYIRKHPIRMRNYYCETGSILAHYHRYAVLLANQSGVVTTKRREVAEKKGLFMGCKQVDDLEDLIGKLSLDDSLNVAFDLNSDDEAANDSTAEEFFTPPSSPTP